MKVSRPRKHLLLKLGVFLLLGAIVNVAVAWGIAVWEPQKATDIGDVTADAVSIFADHGFLLPSDEDLYADQCVGFGLAFTSTVIEGNPDTDTPDKFWILTEAGWPMKSLAGVFHLVMDMSGSSVSSLEYATELSPRVRTRNAVMPQLAYVLPQKTLWPGFAINTIFYAAILWLLWIAPGRIKRFIRVSRGRCPACGFIIAPGTAAASGGPCSECGQSLASHR